MVLIDLTKLIVKESEDYDPKRQQRRVIAEIKKHSNKAEAPNVTSLKLRTHLDLNLLTLLNVFENLETLDLAGSSFPIIKPKGSTLSLQMPSVKNLILDRTLCMDDQGEPSDEDDEKVFLFFLAVCPNLESLCARETYLFYSDVLMEQISKLPLLSCLKLSRDLEGSDRGRAGVTDQRKTYQTPSDTQGLASLATAPRLQELSLQNCCDIEGELVPALLPRLHRLRLDTVDLYGGEMGGSAHWAAPVLAPHLHTLRLYSNLVSPHNLPLLRLPELRKLTLTSHKATPKVLADFLRELSRLEVLRIDSPLDEASFSALAEVSQRNLRTCRLPAPTATSPSSYLSPASFAQLLKNCPSLTELALASNRFSPDCLPVLLKSQLVSLDLSLSECDGEAEQVGGTLRDLPAESLALRKVTATGQIFRTLRLNLPSSVEIRSSINTEPERCWHGQPPAVNANLTEALNSFNFERPQQSNNYEAMQRWQAQFFVYSLIRQMLGLDDSKPKVVRFDFSQWGLAIPEKEWNLFITALTATSVPLESLTTVLPLEPQDLSSFLVTLSSLAPELATKFRALVIPYATKFFKAAPSLISALPSLSGLTCVVASPASLTDASALSLITACLQFCPGIKAICLDASAVSFGEDVKFSLTASFLAQLPAVLSAHPPNNSGAPEAEFELAKTLQNCIQGSTGERWGGVGGCEARALFLGLGNLPFPAKSVLSFVTHPLLAKLDLSVMLGGQRSVCEPSILWQMGAFFADDPSLRLQVMSRYPGPAHGSPFWNTIALSGGNDKAQLIKEQDPNDEAGWLPYRTLIGGRNRIRIEQDRARRKKKFDDLAETLPPFDPRQPQEEDSEEEAEALGTGPAPSDSSQISLAPFLKQPVKFTQLLENTNSYSVDPLSRRVAAVSLGQPIRLIDLADGNSTVLSHFVANENAVALVGLSGEVLVAGQSDQLTCWAGIRTPLADLMADALPTKTISLPESGALQWLDVRDRQAFVGFQAKSEQSFLSEVNLETSQIVQSWSVGRELGCADWTDSLVAVVAGYQTLKLFDRRGGAKPIASIKTSANALAPFFFDNYLVLSAESCVQSFDLGTRKPLHSMSVVGGWQVATNACWAVMGTMGGSDQLSLYDCGRSVAWDLKASFRPSVGTAFGLQFNEANDLVTSENNTLCHYEFPAAEFTFSRAQYRARHTAPSLERFKELQKASADFVKAVKRKRPVAELTEMLTQLPEGSKERQVALEDAFFELGNGKSPASAELTDFVLSQQTDGLSTDQIRDLLVTHQIEQACVLLTRYPCQLKENRPKPKRHPQKTRMRGLSVPPDGPLLMLSIDFRGIGLDRPGDHGLLAKLLIEHGAEVNLKCENGHTPLSWAISRGAFDVSRVLLANGAVPKPSLLASLAANSHGEPDRLELAQLLLDRLPAAGKALFAFAKDLSLLELLEGRVKPEDFTQFDDWSRHQLAQLRSRPDEVPLAVFNRTPLMTASLPCLRWMIGHGADVNVVDPLSGCLLGHTALSFWEQTDEIVREFVRAGGNVHARDNEGMTPLHHAASQYSPTVVQVLLDAGADVLARDLLGRTPRDRNILSPAYDGGRREVHDLLLSWEERRK